MSISEKLLIIAQNEQKVYDAGFEAGKSQGGDTTEAFLAGKKAEYDKFWDSYQQNGNLKNYKYSFAGKGWNTDVFYPKYDIIPTSAESMFSGFNGTAFSLTQRLEELGKTMDLSSVTESAANAFYESPFTEIPYLNLGNATTITRIFYCCGNLVTTGLTINSTHALTRLFDNCYALKNLTVGGTIGQNGFDVHWSKNLSKESLISILTACNKQNIDKTITLTLPNKCIDGATDTATLLANYDGKIEYTIPVEVTNSLNLKHKKIIPGSVCIYPLDAAGNYANPEWTDDGNGNIKYQMGDLEIQVGTIDYETGVLSASIYPNELLRKIKIQYTIQNPYTNAIANNYTIAFA